MAELGAGNLLQGDPALNDQEQELNERLKRLYPAVNEEETPLPRSWSPKDKYSYIGLSQNNLRVHYKVLEKPCIGREIPGNINRLHSLLKPGSHR
ncbi:ran-binding protein 10 isoform X1 [Tachysurus ichikawai]